MKKHLLVSFVTLFLYSSIFNASTTSDLSPVKTHNVQFGESLWEVAQIYYPTMNIHKAVEILIEINSLDTTIIQPGQTLILADTSQ